MTRKLLFLLFSDDACHRNHALMYALELDRAGHEVRLIVEGAATKGLHELGDPSSRFAELFREAAGRGLVAGACRRAASGCATEDPERKVTDMAVQNGVALLDDMQGHASIERFVSEGYELVVL